MEENIETLKRELKSEGVRQGLCSEWQTMMDDATDKRTLVQMYMRGIDFCIINDYPPVATMEKHFKGMSREFGLFINEAVTADNLPQAALMGACDARLQFDNYAVSMIYVLHRSLAQIAATDHSIVSVDCFGDSEVIIEASGGSRVSVYCYGRAAVQSKHDEESEVKIIYKNKKTYE